MANGPPVQVKCNGCHDKEQVHGTLGRVTCRDCHGSHYIYKAGDFRSATHWKNLKRTCGRCHPGQSGTGGILSRLPFLRVVTHPKQDFSKRFDESMCVGCHQGKAAHGENKPVNEQGCYTCHASMGKGRFLSRRFHVPTGSETRPADIVAGYLSLVALIFSVAVIFIKAEKGKSR
jgi:hypothetical protein